MPHLSKFRVFALLPVLILAATACLKQEPEAIPARAAGRKDQTLETRAAILRAEDRGLVDDSLRAACSSPLPEIRETAARALGRIGGDEAIRLAANLLDDLSPEVRGEAVFALGLSRDSDVLNRILRLTGDDSPVVRTRLALALNLIPGELRRQAIATLIGDPDPDVAEQACLAAATLPARESTVQQLAGMLQHGQRQVRHAAAYALARTARKTEDSPANELARKALVDRAQDQDPAIRLEVARGLRYPRNGSEEGVLKRLLGDTERLIRIEALISVAYPGGPPIELLDGLGSKDFHVVQAAIEGMAVNGDPAVIKALSEVAVNPGPVPIRSAAIQSLRKAAPAVAAQLLPIQLWRSTDPVLRGEAARTAGIFPLPDNMPILEELLLDNIPSVRSAAIMAASHRPGSLSDLLGDTLADNHPDIRYALARAAGSRIQVRRSGVKQPPERISEAFSVLDELWERGKDDTQAFPRMAVLDAVGGATPDPIGKKILMQALAHDDFRFRAHAAEVLETVYGDAPSGGPGPAADRPLADYIEMLRWAETGWDAVVTVERAGFTPGSFTIRLDTRRAPRSCWNFARLAKEGFYDGLSFHRLEPNFIVQGGDPWRDGLGDPGFSLLPELSDGPFQAGAVGMKQGLETGDGSQFFITLAPQRRLDARNVRIGTITENLLGVALLLIPEDRILSIEIRAAAD